MANITRRGPISDLTTLQDRLNQIFGQQFWPLERLTNLPELTGTNFIPAVDVYEDQHSITVSAELPGVNDKDVNISLENGVLTINGERKMENEENRENFHRIERNFGRFIRTFTLPPTVDPENVKAEFNNGVLRITLAKREEAKPKQIKIESGKGEPTPVKPSKAA
jgi:HSP20 family protein